ncbi:TlpA family protein disulfide reductase [Draconibacterium sp.]|nr:TlpA family protein disulfide reductase [Draconibacterium sp.]
MKNLISFILITFIAFACHKSNTVMVSGKITNPADESTGIRINYFDRNDTITVNPNGTFYAELALEEEHLAWFDHGRYSIPLYLVPGAKIKLEFDAKESEGWIYSNAKITGKKSAASAFLYSLDLRLNKPLREELAEMKVDSFVTTIKNLDQSTSSEIEKFIANDSPSDKFIERITLKQKVKLAHKYFDFTRYHPNDDPIAAYLQGYLDEIPLNDEENCKEISEYSYFLYQYHDNIIDKKMEGSGLYKETAVYINKLADEIIALDVPQEIKDDIGEWNFSVFYKRPDSLRQVYRARYGDVVKNQEYVDRFEKTADARDKLKPGNTAPTFKYPDINGEMISLESFKGKVVYIDVWATWCGPCKYQFPYQKKLEAELHGQDIVFVSISVDEDKDIGAWEKMVKEEELGGYQLFAKGTWENKKIIKDYVIKGIPYFIIIDKEGKLVEVFASRPSDPETKEKLLNLAQS